MVFKLKILFFSLISCCYLNTVFEFSDIEEKQNFQNETHTYTYQSTLDISTTKIESQKQLNNTLFFSTPEIVFSQKGISKIVANYNLHKYSEPPERRYILYSSLLI
jgi:hypothetical protein